MSTQLILEKLDKHQLILEEHSELLRSMTETLSKQGELIINQGKLLAEHTRILSSHTKTLSSHSELLANHDTQLNKNSQLLIEILSDITKQGKKISELQIDVKDLKNDVGIIKKVLTDSNKQIRRHERFIKHIKNVP